VYPDNINYLKKHFARIYSIFLNTLLGISSSKINLRKFSSREQEREREREGGETFKGKFTAIAREEFDKGISLIHLVIFIDLTILSSGREGK